MIDAHFITGMVVGFMFAVVIMCLLWSTNR
jgi:tetrahydromethanopterin S-methyltransferase subunit F